MKQLCLSIILNIMFCRLIWLQCHSFIFDQNPSKVIMRDITGINITGINYKFKLDCSVL